MSVWKSPILYLSVLLVLAVGGALVAPFVVDWNGYRVDLESYGERLSGRNVRINGPISVKLFPFPQVQAERVIIANGDDPESGIFTEADRVTVRVALGGLLAGQLRVEDITVDNPLINLVREEDGSVNWIMLPQEELRSSRLLETVRLDRILLNFGKVRFTDRKRAAAVEINVESATFSAPGIEGPWRSSGQISLYGTAAAYTFNSSMMNADQPLKFSFKVTPADPAFPSLVFDGSRALGEIAGKLRLDPVVAADQKQSLEGQFRPVATRADVKLSDARAELNNIEISTSGGADKPSVVKGQITADLTDRISARASFSTPRLNLDTLFGAQSLQTLRSRGVLGMFNQLMARYPERLDASLELRATTITVGGDAMEEMEFSAETSRDAVRIKRFAANLPGRSRMLADGTVFGNGGAADFGGKLALESNDFRELVSWLWPNAKPEIARLWVGSRGQFKMQSNLSWTERFLEFQDMDFELDGQRGKGQVQIGQGTPPVLAVNLNVEKLDIDNFARSREAAGSAVEWTSLVSAFVGWSKNTPIQLSIGANTLLLNGVTAQALQLDVDASPDAVSIKGINIGSISGARVSAQGNLTNKDDVFEGVIDTGIIAQDPLPLLQLVGLLNPAAPQPWQRVVGETTLSGQILLAKGDVAPKLGYSLKGKSGPLRIDATGEVTELAMPSKAINSVVKISSDDGRDVLRLFGVDAQVSEPAPGSLSISAKGAGESGYQLEAALLAVGAQAAFKGNYKPGQGQLPVVNGHVTLSTDDGRAFIAAAGMPGAEGLSGPLQASAHVLTEQSMLVADGIKATMGAQVFEGRMAIAQDYAVTADFSTNELGLSSVLGAALLSWNGEPLSADSNFSDTAPFALNGELWLRPPSLVVSDGLKLSEPVIGVESSGRERQVTVRGTAADGETMTLEASLLPNAGQYEINVTGRGRLDVKQIMTFDPNDTAVSGAAAAEVKASGTGLSPGAAIADLSGEGKVRLEGLTFSKLAPDVFAENIGKVQSGDDLRAAVASLQGPQDFVIPDQDVSFKIVAGKATFDTVTIDGAATRSQLSFVVDLVDQTIAAGLRIKLKTPQGLPDVTVLYDGPPASVRRRIETSAVASKLGFDIMAREMAELERAQAEQQRIIEQEEAQQKLDAERFKAYQEQRAELRLRQREVKIHAIQRSLDAADLKKRLEQGQKEFAAINKSELPRISRIIRIHKATIGGLPSKAVKSRRVFIEPDLQSEPGPELGLPDGFELPPLEEPPAQP